MPVPTSISDLSTTAALNFPAGTDSPSQLDDVQRAHASFIAQLRDGVVTTGYLPAGTGAVTTTVQSKLRESVSVKDFGAVGNGVTDDTAAIQAALDASSGFGASLYIPTGVYVVAGLSVKQNTAITGCYGSTILKRAAAYKSNVLYNAADVLGPAVENVFIENIIFDGSASSWPGGGPARSAVDLSNVSNVVIKHCQFKNATGYGLGFQAVPGGSTLPGTQENIYIENSSFLDNGVGVGTDTYDGLDIKWANRITLVDCYAHRNYDKGINVRGSKILITGGSCEDNGQSGYELGANINTSPLLEPDFSLVGCVSKGNGGQGFAFNSGVLGVFVETRVSLSCVKSYENSENGLYVTTESSLIYLAVSDSFFYDNDGSGIRIGASSGNEAEAVLLSNCVCTGNGNSGVFTLATPIRMTNCVATYNSAYGFYEQSTGSKSVIGSGCDLSNNVSGPIGVLTGALNTGLRVEHTATSNASNVVASAATITVPFSCSHIVVTGTTNITSISPGRINQVVTIRFSGVLTMSDGSNLVLVSPFTTTSNDTITLVCESSGNWFELCRSVN